MAPYGTMIWLSRVEGLRTHLRIITQECEASDRPQVQRIGRQAKAGIAEADRYIVDKEWSEGDE